MTHVMDGADSVQRLECAIKYRKVLVEQTWSAFDRAIVIDEFDNGFHRWIVISEFLERGGDRVIHNLDGAATDEFLVLDQRQIRFDTGGIAIHHESDRTGRSEHRSLC